MTESLLFETLCKKIFSLLRPVKNGYYMASFEYKGEKEDYVIKNRDVALLVEELLNGNPRHIYYCQALVRLESVEKSFFNPINPTGPYHGKKLVDKYKKYMILRNKMLDLSQDYNPDFGRLIIDEFQQYGINPLKLVPLLYSNWLINRLSIKIDYKIKHTANQIRKLNKEIRNTMIKDLLNSDSKDVFAKNPYLWGLLYSYSVNPKKLNDIKNPTSK